MSKKHIWNNKKRCLLLGKKVIECGGEVNMTLLDADTKKRYLESKDIIEGQPVEKKVLVLQSESYKKKTDKK